MEKWIKFTDARPKAHQPVLVYMPERCAMFVIEFFHEYEPGPEKDFSHWMPLPDPPAEPADYLISQSYSEVRNERRTVF